MVDTQVKLVVGEHLWCLCCRVATGVRVGVLVVNLEAGKDGVVKAHVDTRHGKAQGVCLVGLQRRQDGQPRRGVTVHDIH